MKFQFRSGAMTYEGEAKDELQLFQSRGPAQR